MDEISKELRKLYSNIKKNNEESDAHLQSGYKMLNNDMVHLVHLNTITNRQELVIPTKHCNPEFKAATYANVKENNHAPYQAIQIIQDSIFDPVSVDTNESNEVSLASSTYASPAYSTLLESQKDEQAPIIPLEKLRKRSRTPISFETDIEVFQFIPSLGSIPTSSAISTKFNTHNIPTTTTDEATKNCGSVSQKDGKSNEKRKLEAGDDRVSQNSCIQMSQFTDLLDSASNQNAKQILKGLLNPNNLRALANFIGGAYEANTASTEVQKMLENSINGSDKFSTFTEIDTPKKRRITEIDESREQGHSLGHSRNNILSDCEKDCSTLFHRSFIDMQENKTQSLGGPYTGSRAVRGEEIEVSQSVIPEIQGSSIIGRSNEYIIDSDDPSAKRWKKLESTKKFYNNDPEWHSLKERTHCPICNKSTQSLVSHFVNEHPDSEVVTSRLSPDAANSLRNSKENFKYERIMRPRKGKSKAYNDYVQFCYFCNVYKSLRRHYWVNHLAMHTGYFQCKCTDCSKKFAHRSINHICKRKRRNLEEIPQSLFQKEILMAYLCDICNFVRFNKTEIEKHLYSEHEDTTMSFKEVVFLRLPMNKKDQELEELRGGSENDSKSNGDIQQTVEEINNESLKSTKTLRVHLDRSIISNTSNTPTRGIDAALEGKAILSTLKECESETSTAKINKDVETTTKPEPEPDLASKSIIKNNNPELHSLNKNIKCQICGIRYGRSIINHYVNFHPNIEVLTSRLAPDAANSLRNSKQSFKFKLIRPGSKSTFVNTKIKQFCYFCNKLKCYSKWFWIEHLVRHTGYYQYECIDCSKKFVRRDISHVCKDKNNMKMIPQPQFQKDNIMAYICDICNYVRFDKNEIVNHLRNEHGENYAKCFNKFIFVRLSTYRSKDKMKEYELDIIDYTQMTTKGDENVETLKAREDDSTSSSIASNARKSLSLDSSWVAYSDSPSDSSSTFEESDDSSSDSSSDLFSSSTEYSTVFERSSEEKFTDDYDDSWEGYNVKGDELYDSL